MRKTTYLGITIFLIIFLSISFSCCAADMPSTIKECEDAIEVNNKKIEQCEAIKTQLHITAEVMRQQEFYDEAFVETLSAKWSAQNEYQNSMITLNEQLYTQIEELKKPKLKYIGDFKITYYCTENYHHICNNGDATKTATGTRPTPGRTIAVDPRKIPYGTKVVIDGHTYIAEDCGGAIKGNRIDICTRTHSEAIKKGTRKNVPVYIVVE